MLTYTIEKSQPVDLMLYKLADDTEFTYGDTIELTHSESAEPDEPFLGEFIGYLHGTPILDENGQPFDGDIPENEKAYWIAKSIYEPDTPMTKMAALPRLRT